MSFIPLASLFQIQTSPNLTSFSFIYPPHPLHQPQPHPHLELHSTLKMASHNFFKRSNDAIHANGDHRVNGATSDIAITTHGSDWYWVSDHLTSVASMYLKLTPTRPSALSWSSLPSSSLPSRSPGLAHTVSSTTSPLLSPWSPVSLTSPWALTWERLASAPNSSVVIPRFPAYFARSSTFATLTGKLDYAHTRNQANATQGLSPRRCCSWISS